MSGYFVHDKDIHATGQSRYGLVFSPARKKNDVIALFVSPTLRNAKGVMFANVTRVT